MRLVLLANYRPDRQESMLRFAEMLRAGFAERRDVDVSVWHPPVVLGHVARLLGGRWRKWFGYVDQYLIAPLALLFKRIGDRDVRYHICDHSNAPFSQVLPPARTTVTCHDVIAIEAAGGNEAYGVRPTGLGLYQQRYIRHYLLRQRRVACVSAYTLDRLRSLDPDGDAGAGRVWEVIPNAFNAVFSPRPWDERLGRRLGVEPLGYLFHLGSGHPRKNRKRLLDLLAHRRRGGASERLVLAGRPPSPAELAHAEHLSLGEAVTWLGSVSHEEALTLYSHCHAFVFPSLSEGFGWPIIEAQACGAPVVCSARAPMPEVGGEGALYADPLSTADFAAALAKLDDHGARERLVHDGFLNAERFRAPAIIDAYARFIGA